MSSKDQRPIRDNSVQFTDEADRVDNLRFKLDVNEASTLESVHSWRFEQTFLGPILR